MKYGKWRCLGGGLVALVVSMAWLQALAQQRVGPDTQTPNLQTPNLQTPNISTASGAVHIAQEPGRPSQAVLYDPAQRSLAVYHIDRETGSISLKSVRRVEWDLQMIDFNTSEPLPQDIRGGLQR
jgi:hypothetical protein